MAPEIPKTMKALQLAKDGSSPSLNLISLPTPTPKADELLLKIHASPILPSDILNSKGSFKITTFPRVPGRDFAGTVALAPSNPSLIGTSVFGTSGGTFSFTSDGAHAEYAVVPANVIAPMPKGLTFAQAANLGTTFTIAHLALTRARMQKGETVMVLGAGGAVGSAVVQLAENMAAGRVLQVGRSSGPGVDVNSATDPGLSEARKLTGGKGPDVIVDTVGDAKLVAASLEVLASGGRFSFIAAPRGPEGSVIPVDFLAIYRAEKELVGNNTTIHSQQSMGEVLKGMVQDFEKGDLKIGAIEQKSGVSMDEAVEAYGKKGKWTIVME